MKIFKLFILATTSYITLNFVTPAACFNTKTANDAKSYIIAETQDNDSSEYPCMPADAIFPGGEMA
nr:hypothetical protein [uncultured Blautia sp.]